jgi:glycine betaine/proline transport system substrate-binding protein
LKSLLEVDGHKNFRRLTHSKQTIMINHRNQNKLRSFFIINLFFTIASFSLYQIAVCNSFEKPIKIVTNNWTSQIILSHITGAIFEEMGFRVEYHPMDSREQWGGIYRGKYHVQIEVWEGNGSKLFQRMIKAGGIVDAGNHDIRTREEWWYPSYVEKSCPGLPSWKALNNCYQLFVVPETVPKGRYLSGPWGKPDRARIRALNLKFKVVEMKKAVDLRERLKQALNKRQPILVFNWTPNWTDVDFEGKFIEFPEYTLECETDPKWGINPDFHHDCGNPKNGWLKKATWSGMEKEWPCAFQTLVNISFNNRMLIHLIYKVDIDRQKIESVASEWIKQHALTWTKWIPNHCRNHLQNR